MNPIKIRCGGWLKSKASRLICLLVISTLLVAILSGAAISKYVVLIEDENIQTIVYTSLDDPEAILSREEIRLGEHDTYSFSGIDSRKGTITINRASLVTVRADGETQNLYVTQGTVGDALEQMGITVGEEDLINVSLSEPVRDDIGITVSRITYQTVEKETAIPFTVREIPTQTLSKGKTRTLSEGVDGVRTATVKQKLQDGVVIEETQLSEAVTREPVAAQVLIGDPTAPVSQLIPAQEIELDANGNPVNYSQKVTGKATAYSALGKRTRLVPGNVAMNLSQFPKGTKLYIKTPDGSFTYGYSVVKDTGPAVQNGVCLVDLFFGSYRESCLFGAKTVDIYVLN